MESKMEKETIEVINERISNCEKDLMKIIKASNIIKKISLPDIRINFDKLITQQIIDTSLEVKRLKEFLNTFEDKESAEKHSEQQLEVLGTK